MRLLAPGAGHLRARVAARVLGTVPLDERPGEAFKVVTLSSMRVSAASWDIAVHSGRRSLTAPQQGWIGHRAPTARTLGLRGGTSAWKVGTTTAASTMASFVT